MNEDDEIPEVGDVPPEPVRGASDAPLVARVRAGDPNAFGELYDRWFDRVFDLAYRILWDEQAAADAAQDAFLSAWRNIDRLEDPNAFGGWLLRIGRNGALDRKRRDERVRPVDDERLAMIERAQRPEETLGALDDPAQVAEDASYVALVWDAADALGERDREVLDLQLRHGLAPAEIADVVGLNRNAANQLVHRVRQRLGTAIGARMLWHAGEPLCATLRAELVAADAFVFDSDTVRVIDRHAAACDACTSRKRTRLSPAQMFTAIPIMTIPALKTRAAYALADAGVPMSGSQIFGAAGGGKPRRARRLLVSAITGGIIIILLILGAAALSREPSPVVAVVNSTTTTSRSTSTTRSSTTTSTSTSTSTSSTTTTTVAKVVVPPTAPPTTVPRTTTTTTIPLNAAFTLRPNTAVPTYLMTNAPLLSWNVTGAARGVHVYDSVGNVDSTSARGRLRVCPGTTNGGFCTVTKLGTYTYTLDVFNAAGTRVLHRTLTLTVS